MNNTQIASFAHTAAAVIEQANAEHGESVRRLEWMRQCPTLTNTPFLVVTDMGHRVGYVDGTADTLGTEIRADVTPHHFSRETAKRVAYMFREQGARLMTEYQFHVERLEKTDETIEAFEQLLDQVLNTGRIQ